MERNRSVAAPAPQSRRSSTLHGRLKNCHALHVRRHRKDIGLNESRKRPGQSSFLGSPRSVSAPRASNERHDWPDAPALGTAGASPSSRALRILSLSAGRPRGAGVPTPPWQRGSVGRRPLLYGEWPYGVRLTPLDPLG